MGRDTNGITNIAVYLFEVIHKNNVIKHYEDRCLLLL